MTALNGHGAKANYEEVAINLRLAYDRMVDARESSRVPQWKLEERLRFLAVLKHERRRTLLDVGAGTGVHARFFYDEGIDVVCTDLSPAMIRACRSKGLIAHEMDFLNLSFEGREFQAAFAMNCLLHVPRATLQQALLGIRKAIQPGGLLYLGQYGGVESERVWPDDEYDPKRFFSYLTDDQLNEAASRVFDVVRFCRVLLPQSRDSLHFQSLILRRR